MAVAKEDHKSKVVAKSSTSPLDLEQVLRASKALIGKLNSGVNNEGKTDLLADADADANDTATPVWLVLSTKRHLGRKTNLKPSKIVLPHPYIKSDEASTASLRVCLITTDPQRRYKDIVDHPNFPIETAKYIKKVIDVSKLKSKFGTYEEKRKLLDEHDVFLADDRIITHLPKILGNVFYKTSSKRPVPVQLAGRKEQGEEPGRKRIKLSQGGTKVTRSEPKPSDVAAEIERALSSALVHIAPSASTSVKVGVHTQPAEHVQDNIQTVVDRFVEKYLPGEKWSGLRSLHIKGPNTVSLPIWQTDELWVDKEKDVQNEVTAADKPAKKRKRSALSEATEMVEVPGPDGKMRQVEKSEIIEPKKLKRTKKAEKTTAPAVAAKDVVATKPVKEDTVTTKAAKKTRMKAADLI